jgi:hypothetical protein
VSVVAFREEALGAKGRVVSGNRDETVGYGVPTMVTPRPRWYSRTMADTTFLASFTRVT